MTRNAGDRQQPIESDRHLRAADRGRSRPGRAQRALRTISACNRALLRATDEFTVLQEICETIVTAGPYALVSIGYLTDGNGEVLRPVAFAPAAAGARTTDECPWADLPGGGGPMAIALSRGEPFCAAAEPGDSAFALWFDRMKAFNGVEGVAAAIPLDAGGARVGALGILRAGQERFEAMELGFLQELASDIGCGILAVRERALKSRGEARLARVNRALHTLSAGNRTLLRAQTEQQLLAEMCAVIVDDGGYAAAWVGYAENDEGKSIRVMAHSGMHADSLAALRLTWAESGIGVGPTGTAIRSGKPIIGRDLHADPRLLAAVEQFLSHRHSDDFGAASVFPLRVENRIIGNLSIYAVEPDAFDDDEARLLTEMADDLAYGIGVLRTRERHREAEAKIQYMAFHDPVTGLPNRLRLREKLETALVAVREQRRPLSVMVLKVEQFQEITDSLGHCEGAQLLGELATRLGRLVGEDETLARGGEDEFVILVPGRGAAYAGAAAQRLMIALSEPVELSGLTISARMSVGIALAPGHGTDPDALIRRASVAAFQARSTGTGYAIYVGGLDEDCTRRLALMGDLRRAIDQNELQLYVQPKVAMVAGRVCGAEALLRWRHPQLGIVETGEFVKLAEQAGLIGSLTHWVLDAAFGHAYAWHEAGFEQPLAVNLSAQDLHDPLLLDHVRGLFATWGARPEWIQFELTESALMQDPAGTLETLRRLRKLGVELFIDDYGTGYSSLSYLQKLPVDAIKIDQSFVGRMTDDKDSAIIVRSTIDLGHNLALRVVAEGVENQAIWTQLAALGCDAAQGYFVSRPLPAEQFRDWERASPWHCADAL